MLRSRNIIAGKYYVNNAREIAREVLEVDDRTVKFNTHHLDTGNSCQSASECTIRDFRHWADHEATPSEMAALHLRRMEAEMYEPQVAAPAELQRIAIDLDTRLLIGESALPRRSPL